MARKRKQPKRAPRLTAAQRRVYERGVRAGLARAKQARHRQAVAAGKRSGEVRRAKKVAKPRAEVVGVDEIVLYESDEREAALFHLDWREFVRPTQWAVRAVILSGGREAASIDLQIDPEWDKEAAAATVRREVRSWLKTYHAEHPQDEGYQATLFRLALRAVSA